MKIHFALNSFGGLTAAILLPSARGQFSAGSIFSNNDPMPVVKTVKDLEKLSMSAEARIVGGAVSDQGEFPWFASSTGEYYCGASLIHQNILLSAAHCIDAFMVGSVVNIGSIARGSNFGGGTTRTITSVRKHPEYDPNVVKNDFLLLRLNEPVTGVTPIELNTEQSVPFTGQPLISMGFGTLSESGEVSSVLRDVELLAFDHDTCRRQYSQVAAMDGFTAVNLDEDVTVCADFPGGGKASCQGDSGGPLVTVAGKQVGVVSFGVGCGDPNFAGVYARVSGVIEWINQTICEWGSPSGGGDCGDAGGSDTGGGSDTDSQGPSDNDIVFPTNDSGTTLILLRFKYDFWASETTFTFSQGSNILFEGPEYSPLPFQTKDTIFEANSGQTYTFTVFDSACDGLGSSISEGFFEIYHLPSQNEEVLLASGDHSFTCSQSVDFFVPGTDQPISVKSTSSERCQDGTGSDESSDSCVWLTNGGDLCDWIDVAYMCPVTCGACSVIESLTCTDQLKSVKLEDAGNQTCEWLSSHMDTHEHVCGKTEVAFHCPATCGTGGC